MRGTLIMLALCVTPAAAADKSMQPIAGDPVTTESGRIAGTQFPSGVRAYLGIPFAEPPTGPLRWAPPRPASWSGVFNADRKGPACIQVLRPHDINHYFGEEATGEDCLTMNIWTPAGAPAGAKRPVIVFLYGGGFTIGSSGMANYDGEAMAAKGAVFVNFNYRVGALGFLAHTELTAEQRGASGNYGIMDQTLALKWVRANIATFGGDPDKVLIMGQSAGASSVAAQVFSPAARGLFRAAVMSSGCNYKTDGPTLADAEKTGLQFQKALGAADLAAMRDIAADRILALQSENQLGLRVSGVRIAGPIIDGRTLPRPRAAMIADGDFAKVPVIASYTANDLSFGYEPLLGAKTVADYRAAASTLWGDKADAFLKLYPAKTDADVPAAARRATTDGAWTSGARACGQAGVPTYVGEFARIHPYAPGVRIADQNTATVGAYHTADIPYWFGTQDAFNWQRTTRNWQSWDRQLSGQMMDALIAMAETGSPSTKAMPWTAWSPKAEVKLVFGDAMTPVTLDKKRLDWLAANPPTVATGPRSARPID